MKPVSPAAVLITVLVVGCLWAIPAAAQDTPASSAAAPPVDYLRDVRPILRAKCSMCHNEAEAGGGLRLDGAAHVMKGGDSGAAIVAGDSAQSRIIQAVEQSGDLKMPPPEEGKPLEAAQIEILRRWIDQGAAVPEDETQVQHWSFQKPVRPAVPMWEVTETNPVAQTVNPIDSFLHKDHQSHDVQAFKPAAKNVLFYFREAFSGVREVEEYYTFARKRLFGEFAELPELKSAESTSQE